MTSEADGGKGPHCPPQEASMAGSIQRSRPIAPPRTADGVRRRREAPGPVPPPGAAGMRTAHAPGTREHPAAGTMTPATRGKGARAKR